MNAPEFSADWYRHITELAHGTPHWVHTTAEVGTDAGLLLFAALFVVGWWRARGDESRTMALALLAPVLTVAAYLVSETSKSALQQERPCRAVAQAANIAACPPVGDWSFPSNHSTIAAAAAVSVVLVWRAMAWLVLPIAVIMAASRVFVGVHYPHDVAAGLLVGSVVTVLLGLLLARPGAAIIDRLRPHPLTRPLLTTSAPIGADGRDHRVHERV